MLYLAQDDTEPYRPIFLHYKNYGACVIFFNHTYFQHHSQFQLPFMFRQSVGMSVYRHATQEAPTQCWWQASACLSPPWQQWQQPQRPLHRPHPRQSSLIRGWCDSEGRVGLLQITRLVSGLTCPWSIDCSVNVCVNTRHTALRHRIERLNDLS